MVLLFYTPYFHYFTKLKIAANNLPIMPSFSYLTFWIIIYFYFSSERVYSMVDFRGILNGFDSLGVFN